MKASIITVVLNNKLYIEDCIQSVLNQSYEEIEYIVIDGGSTDGTIEIIKKYGSKISRWVSKPDTGIYDAMNKGIQLATGEIIGFLNSDDIYAEGGIIGSIVACFAESAADTCYGDLVYVNCENTEKQVRYWRSGTFNKDKFRRGWMPPHPTFFVRRHVYEKCGSFDLNFPLAADYELMLRFLYKYEITTTYIPKVLVKMRTGGRSSPGLLNTAKAVFENYEAWKINDLPLNPMTFILKPFSKLRQLNKLPPSRTSKHN